jgi:GNAT superfamily N-acetyltransferase
MESPSRPGYALRLARRDDIAPLRELIDASVRGLSAGSYSADEIDASLVHVFGVDSRIIDDGTYYVIERGGELAAAGGWSARRTLYGGDQMKSEADPRLDPAVDAARIRAFFVHPSHARRGLARRLFLACRDQARAAGFRKLELAATLPGIPLYSALGFAARETIETPMPGGLVLRCVRMDRPIDD